MPLQRSEIRKERAPSEEQARVFQQLLTAIETVRLTRQEQYRERYHPQLKRFTQQELNDEICPTYKNWLIGRSFRLPTRTMLMTIADYLECNLRERNDLLLAAQYLPEEQPVWEGEVLQHALTDALALMETLPYPALVITHTLQVQAANDFFLRLFDIQTLDTIPPHQRTTMHVLFSPEVRGNSMMDAEAHARWHQHVLYALQSFKQQNILCQYDAWYQQCIQQWCAEIEGFRECWEEAQDFRPQEVSPTKRVFVRQPTTGEVLPILVRHMHVSVSSKVYPSVSALLPVDEAARTVYASLGSATR